MELLQKPSLFNYFHFKVLFLILVHICFTFQNYVTITECLWKYPSHCLLFLSREYISYSAQYIFRKYWCEYYTLLVLYVIVEIEVVGTIFNYSSIITVKIEM